MQVEKKMIPECTYSFLKKKIAGFYPYYIFVVLVLNLGLFRGVILKSSLKDMVILFLHNIPRILLFDCNGFTVQESATIVVDWYLSVMIFSMSILFPLLLYNYEWMAKLILPIIGIFGLGVLYCNYETIIVRREIVNSVFIAQTIRGIAEISLGVWAYEMALRIKEIKFRKTAKICLTICKWLCFVSVIVYSFGRVFKNKFSIVFFVLCLLGIILSFSEKTYNIPYCAVTKYLGKISLPVYLTHMTIAKICLAIFSKQMEARLIIIAVCACPLIAHLVMCSTDFIINKMRKYKYVFIEE